jgi:hypothetical protein
MNSRRIPKLDVTLLIFRFGCLLWQPVKRRAAGRRLNDGCNYRKRSTMRDPLHRYLLLSQHQNQTNNACEQLNGP